MRHVACLLLATTALVISGTAYSQAPHALTWSGKSVSIGADLTFGGRDFKVVRIPVRDFSGNKYAITFPAPTVNGVVTSAAINVQHQDTTPFQGEFLIDGFSASAQVADSFVYSLGNLDPASNLFQVNGTVSVAVLMLLGNETIATLSVSWQVPDPLGVDPLVTVTDIGSSLNAVSAAEWWKYVDQVTLIDAADRWLNYVRVWKF